MILNMNMIQMEYMQPCTQLYSNNDHVFYFFIPVNLQQKNSEIKYISFLIIIYIFMYLRTVYVVVVCLYTFLCIVYNFLSFLSLYIQLTIKYICLIMLNILNLACCCSLTLSLLHAITQKNTKLVYLVLNFSCRLDCSTQ